MGSGSSSRRREGNLEVISPRVEANNDERSEIVLDSAPLHDVGHGAIHYRYKLPENSVHEYSSDEKNKIPTGYFYHPKVKDFSESADLNNEDGRKFIKVVKAPISDENKNVFYISAIGLDGNVSAVPKSLWAGIKDNEGSKRIFGHKYYSLTNVVNHTQDVSPKLNTVGEFSMSSDAEISVAVKDTCSIKELKKLISNHYIIPVSILHILGNTNEELADDTFIIDGISNCIFSSEIISVTLSVV